MQAAGRHGRGRCGAGRANHRGYPYLENTYLENVECVLQGVSQDEQTIEAILLLVCHLQQNVFF